MTYHESFVPLLVGEALVTTFRDLEGMEDGKEKYLIEKPP